jgi:hypothetical protein
MYVVRGDGRRVEFWTKIRLPFEPKDALLNARNDLRLALRSLKPRPGQSLQATYASAERSFCDVENVLFYNVGPATFGGLAGSGISFDRSWSPVPPLSGDTPMAHYHCYQLVDALPVRPDAPLWQSRFPLPPLSSSIKPHSIWWEASRAAASPSVSLNESFELKVLLGTPTPIPNLATIIKPLLDGLISAFHIDSQADGDVIQRLAAKTGWPEDEIRRRLTQPTAPLLGARRLVSAYRNFVKWNPADELCERCTVQQSITSVRFCRVELWRLDRQI